MKSLTTRRENIEEKVTSIDSKVNTLEANMIEMKKKEKEDAKIKANEETKLEERLNTIKEHHDLQIK